MDTAQEIISAALRRLGSVGAGQSPRIVENTDALAALQGLYRRWISEGALGSLRDVIPTGDYTAGENERVFRNSEGTTSIDLPETVSSRCLQWDYGLLTASSGTSTSRPPRDGACVVINDAFTSNTIEYIYDGQLKSWIDVATLGLGDIAPFARRDRNGLAACLAIELADEFGVQIGQATIRAAQRFQSSLTNNLSQGGLNDTTPVCWF